MSYGKRFELSDGTSIPALGYGTWQAAPGEVKGGIVEALKCGYEAIDAAKCYGNQKEAGEGIAEGLEATGLKREDVYITSKLWVSQAHPDNVAAALDDTLAELNLEYLDLYLIHFPIALKTSDPHKELSAVLDNDATVKEVAIDETVSIVDTWKAMLALPKSKVRSIGVSNFSAAHIEAITKATGTGPVVNQVEYHARVKDAFSDDLDVYCRANGIHLTGYSPLGNNVLGVPLLVQDPVVVEVAEGLGATPAQVLLAWVNAKGYSVIPKSVSASRIRENFQQVTLPPAAVAALDKLGRDSPARFNIMFTAVDPIWNVNIYGTEAEKAATRQVIV